MKRRTFVILTAAGAIALGAPFCRSGTRSRLLARPDFLAHLCDSATLAGIGADYRLHTPAEAGSGKLIDSIMSSLPPLKTADGSTLPPGRVSDSLLPQLLQEKIREDYASGNTVTVKGWVISRTEARQCALFSLGN